MNHHIGQFEVPVFHQQPIVVEARLWPFLLPASVSHVYDQTGFVHPPLMLVLEKDHERLAYTHLASDLDNQVVQAN